MNNSVSILVTAFEPFGGGSYNASLAAMNALPDTIGAVHIVKCTLPVVFGRCGQVLEAAIAAHHPTAILSLGMAAGRDRITPEVFAVNARYAASADNDGQRFQTLTPIVPDGPAAYQSTLPVEEMVTRLREDGIPAGLSFSAGAYVCNDLFYHLMQTARVPAGFVHVPQALEAAPERPSAMPQETISRAVAVLAALLTEKLS